MAGGSFTLSSALAVALAIASFHAGSAVAQCEPPEQYLLVVPNPEGLICNQPGYYTVTPDQYATTWRPNALDPSGDGCAKWCSDNRNGLAWPFLQCESFYLEYNDDFVTAKYCHIFPISMQQAGWVTEHGRDNVIVGWDRNCYACQVPWVPPSVAPSSVEPSSVAPSSVEPSSVEPSSAEPSSAEPSSAEPSSIEPSSIEPSSIEPSSIEPSSIEPSSVEPSSVEPSSVESSSVEPSSIEPSSVEPSSVEPSSVEPSSAEPSSVEPSSVESDASTSADLESSTTYTPGPSNPYPQPSNPYPEPSKTTQHTTITTVQSSVECSSTTIYAPDGGSSCIVTRVTPSQSSDSSAHTTTTTPDEPIPSSFVPAEAVRLTGVGWAMAGVLAGAAAVML